MNGIMNDNQLTVVKEYEFENPLIQNIDSIINTCYRKCYNNYYHTFENECVYNLNFTNINNNETVNFTISDKESTMYELNKKLALALKRGFKFNQINNFKIKIYSNLSYINIHYHLILGASPLHRQFFKNLLKNHNYIQTYCNNLNNPFHFACLQWYEHNNPGTHT